jgi:hypothetical protein
MGEHVVGERAGLTPSAADIEAAGPGGRQTLHTRYISVGGGRIANPGPGVEGPQVTVEITEIRQLKNPGGNPMEAYYEARFTAKAGNEQLWTGKVWAKRIVEHPTPNLDSVMFEPSPTVAKLLRNQ